MMKRKSFMSFLALGAVADSAGANPLPDVAQAMLVRNCHVLPAEGEPILTGFLKVPPVHVMWGEAMPGRVALPVAYKRGELTARSPVLRVQSAAEGCTDALTAQLVWTDGQASHIDIHGSTRYPAYWTLVLFPHR